MHKASDCTDEPVYCLWHLIHDMSNILKIGKHSSKKWQRFTSVKASVNISMFYLSDQINLEFIRIYQLTCSLYKASCARMMQSDKSEGYFFLNIFKKKLYLAWFNSVQSDAPWWKMSFGHIWLCDDEWVNKTEQSWSPAPLWAQTMCLPQGGWGFTQRSVLFSPSWIILMCSFL